MWEKILIVDDEHEFGTTLAERLMLRDYDAKAIDNVEMAMIELKQWQPDIVLLDLRMPGLHGIEVLREIKRGKKKDIQVIILTGHGTDKDEQEARSLGGFDFLKKPADIDLLVAKIKEAFAEKVERAMLAATFAEEGVFETATKIIKRKNRRRVYVRGIAC